MMKKIALLLIAFLTFSAVSFDLSAKKKQLQVVSFFAETSDLTAQSNKKYDGNGNLCAVIKIGADQNWTFPMRDFVTDYQFDSSVMEHQFWISPGAKKFSIVAPGHEPLEIDLEEELFKYESQQPGSDKISAENCKLQGGYTYILSVESPDLKNAIPIAYTVHRQKINKRRYLLNGVDIPEDKELVYTSSRNKSVGGHDCVDLGLPSGKKWATVNLGAEFPNELGEHYAWSETSPKTEFTQNNCESWDKEIADYSGKSIDPVTQQWGSAWRTPTEEDLQELLDFCYRDFVRIGETFGWKLTGPNGNAIFLPAAGFKDDYGHQGEKSLGYYWSSTPSDVRNSTAMFFGTVNLETGKNARWRGYSIRPVTD